MPDLDHINRSGTELNRVDGSELRLLQHACRRIRKDAVLRPVDTNRSAVLHGEDRGGADVRGRDHPFGDADRRASPEEWRYVSVASSCRWCATTRNDRAPSRWNRAIGHPCRLGTLPKHQPANLPLPPTGFGH